MKKKTKILIIIIACLLVLGSGTGITIYAINNANTKSVGSENSSSEEIANSSELCTEEETTSVMADNKNTSSTSESETTEVTTEDTTESTTEAVSNKNTTATSTTVSSGGNINNVSTSTTSTTSNAVASETHTHSWTPIYTTVHHDAVYETEKTLVQEEWIEYIGHAERVCNGCGKRWDAELVRSGGAVELDFSNHLSTCTGTPGMVGASYHTEDIIEDIIVHEAVYETKDVLVEEAWDEEVIDHYECSCGATK